ncbi:hypothetical protein BDR26DRAFT_866692 [Obelidium mucronatum]|nr:hypothetical protein BDR26DRAFT_866692 [Obelidium mucronatum]
MSTNATLVYTPDQDLRFPDAHIVLDRLKEFVLSKPESQQMTTMVLDLEKIEYIDATGVQTLLATKDFLAHHTGHHVSLHFCNAKPHHMNRLIRISSHIPDCVKSARSSTDSSPSLTANFSANSSPNNSPRLERRPSPTDFPPQMLRSRSSSLSIQHQSDSNRRPSAPSMFPQPVSLSLQPRASKPNLSSEDFSFLGRARSNSQSSNLNLQPLRSKASMTSLSYNNPASAFVFPDPSQKSVETHPTSTFSGFIKVLRSKSSNLAQKLLPQASSYTYYSSDSEDDQTNPFGGASMPLPPPPAKSILKRSGSNSSLANTNPGLVLDSEALSHFPIANAKALKTHS